MVASRQSARRSEFPKNRGVDRKKGTHPREVFLTLLHAGVFFGP
jgi:hypothetical protein